LSLVDLGTIAVGKYGLSSQLSISFLNFLWVGFWLNKCSLDFWWSYRFWMTTQLMC